MNLKNLCKIVDAIKHEVVPFNQGAGLFELGVNEEIYPKIIKGWNKTVLKEAKTIFQHKADEMSDDELIDAYYKDFDGDKNVFVFVSEGTMSNSELNELKPWTDYSYTHLYKEDDTKNYVHIWKATPS